MRGTKVATIAAVVASVGDLLMLYVANAGRPELGLPAAPPVLLWIGGVLGVLAIPLYAFGYRSAAARVAPRYQRHARVISAAGAAGSILGAVIHGCTAYFIHAGLAAGAPARDPLTAVADSTMLVTLWSLATLMIAGASISFAAAVGRGVPRVPPALAWANPAAITILLSLAASATVLSRSFLLPAAPNLAHVVFFASCARAMRAAEPRRA